MNRRRINWHRWDRLLGTMSDRDLALRMGICHTTVHRRRLALGIHAHLERIDWPEWDSLLGTAPDRAIAEAIGCTSAAVCYRRCELNIPAYSGHIDRRSGSIDWSEWDHLLGTSTDRAIADAIGCTPVAVHYRRRKLGIPAYGGSK